MSSQKEPRTSSASRLIALGLAAAVAVAAAFYFGYWVRTPQYAMRTLVDAVKAKDIAYVDQHVDKNQFFSRLFDESLEFSFGAQDSDSDQQANPALKRYLNQSKSSSFPFSSSRRGTGSCPAGRTIRCPYASKRTTRAGARRWPKLWRPTWASSVSNTAPWAR